MNPHFAGRSTVRVLLTARPDPASPSMLDGRFHGWADPQPSKTESEPQGTYPFVFDAPDAATHNELELPTTITAQIAAFAHEIQAFDSLETYMTSQTRRNEVRVAIVHPIGAVQVAR